MSRRYQYGATVALFFVNLNFRYFHVSGWNHGGTFRVLLILLPKGEETIEYIFNFHINHVSITACRNDTSMGSKLKLGQTKKPSTFSP